MNMKPAGSRRRVGSVGAALLPLALIVLAGCGPVRFYYEAANGTNKLCTQHCDQEIKTNITSVHYRHGVYLHVTITVINATKDKITVNGKNVTVSSDAFAYASIKNATDTLPFNTKCVLAYQDSCTINAVYENVSFKGSVKAFERMVKREVIAVGLHGFLAGEKTAKTLPVEKATFGSAVRKE